MKNFSGSCSDGWAVISRANGIFGREGEGRRRAIVCAAAMVGASIVLGGIARGDDTWLGASGGSWTDSTKWSGGGPPDGVANAVFNLNSSAGYTVSIPSNQSVRDLDVDTDTTTLNIASTATLGAFPAGNVNVGTASGQNGSLTLTGAGQFVVNSFYVGTNGGIGVLNASVETTEGFGATGGFVVGAGIGSQGTVNYSVQLRERFQSAMVFMSVWTVAREPQLLTRHS